ncbi:transcriptional regulator [Uliginosibacterium gangwonense]|uniref:transcriptional regulator n=1 Tax=Uliginosibacterium gangwonense TaxID=392736 RepID=UPI00037845AB|nr:transcriptional regulator [Uliginosibacterium gangwonense]
MDWISLINDLIAAGMTQAAIAAEVGVKQPTINGLLSGAQKDMRWSNGERLLALHAHKCPNPTITNANNHCAPIGSHVLAK